MDENHQNCWQRQAMIENMKKFSLLGVRPRSFIDVVEAAEFPAAFGLFKDETNRCVFPVVGCLLERAVNVVLPGGLLVRFGAGKTLGGTRLAFKDLVITAQKLLFVLYGFLQITNRQWEFRHLRDRRFIAGDNRRLKFLPECRKVGLRKREWRRMNLIPTL